MQPGVLLGDVGGEGAHCQRDTRASGRTSAARDGGAGTRALSQCTTSCLFRIYSLFSAPHFWACTTVLFGRASVFIYFFLAACEFPSQGSNRCVFDGAPRSLTVPARFPVLPGFPRRGRPGPCVPSAWRAACVPA